MTFDDRYRRLVDRTGNRIDPDDPADVLAMPVIVRIEKSDPPARADLLVAAARAAVLLCLDERGDPGGPWASALDSWCGARIRKIARRARGTHWVAAGDVDGVTTEDGTGAARAILPGPVGAVDRRIARLQIGGTDLSGDLPALRSAADVGPVVLAVNPGLTMTVGKLAAQVGHGSMLAAGLFPSDEAERWYDDACPLSVCSVTGDGWRELLRAADDDDGTAVAVRDAGYTEIAPGSVTVIAARASRLVP
ncbi:peptidyl-tRNA hydrolase [Williamsia sterculiae]|uniref:peptidyl-tRNA hydrolase n=1 Tax=Williamsia sterculiae TaxID=1344003 RepID=A0A1N7G3F5_9NOCA|nr:peptidyl-tRNA hydrolase [Williamsia sterculiae]SIS06976.1 Peptidyl-tRNA hydrolase [Williamsia sterculiae]